jgi:fructokinase
MDVVCLGELLVDFFPLEIGKPLIEVSAFHPVPGGAPANVAVAVAHLGRKSAFIGKVGDDEFGHWLEKVLSREGVVTEGIRFDPHVRTTINFISQPDVNTYTCLFYRNPGADTCLSPDELDRKVLSQALAFHFGLLSLTDEPIRSATRKAIRIARSVGGLTSFDVNYRPTLWDTPENAREIALSFIRDVDLLKVNEAELELLTGSDELSSAIQLVNLGPSLCLVTLGPKGCYFQTPHSSGLIPAYHVDTVDATGCGDAFIAGILSKLVTFSDWRAAVQSSRLEEIVGYANAVGALTALTQGVIPALPTANQVSEFQNLRGYLPEV